MATIPRRALVRAGVTTAWTAPLVLVGVPAQAATCSRGQVGLVAEEVFGSKETFYDSDIDRLTVQVRVNLTNSGAPGNLVSASLTGAAAELLTLFALGASVNGDIGTSTAEPGASTLTVTAPADVPIGVPGPELKIQYSFSPGFGLHTVNVTFVPDCGDPAVCPVITSVAS